MIPYELDPSLHTAKPESTMLDDGFSPPQHGDVADDANRAEVQSVSVDPALWAKSAF